MSVAHSFPIKLVTSPKFVPVVGLSLLFAFFILFAHPLKASAACAALDTSRGQVTSTFTVPATGSYRVWSRILAPDATNNSFYMSVTSAAGTNDYCGANVGDLSIPANTWTWVDYHDGNSAQKNVMSLTAGTTYTLTLTGREDNVEVDRIIFTTDTACVPDNVAGSYGNNCANPPDTTKPTVSLTAPANNATVSGTAVSVTATATDDVAVRNVEFYVDGTLKTSDTTSPYSYSFDSTSVANGSHTIMAKSYDTSGNATATNSSVTVTVSNAAVCKAASSTLPTAPTGLKTTSATYTNIGLSWTASTPSPGCTTSSYNIYRNGTKVGTSSGTTYPDTGLTINTSYSYTVEAVDSGQNVSAKSTALSASTNADTTNPTVSLTTPANNATVSGTVNATATASDDVGVAKVLFYVDNVLKATDTAAPYTYAVDTTTLVNSTHTIEAIAYDAANNPGSDTANVTVNNAPVCKANSTALPTAPTGFTKTASNYTTLSLSWTASTPSPGCSISSYKILRNGTQVGTSTTTTFPDTGLISGTAYSYTVQAVDSGPNTSLASATFSAATKDDDVAPSVPDTFTATASTASSVSLAWGTSTDNPNPGGSGVSGYNIYRATGATVPTIGGTPYKTVTGTTYSDTLVSASTQYTYVVTAVDNNDNESAPTASKSATTAAPTCSGTPSVPGGLVAGAPTINTTSFSWSASTPTAGCSIAGYHVYRGGLFLKDVTTTSASDTGLAPGTIYTYTVAAFDTSAHASAQSAGLAITTLQDTTAPTVPGGVTAVANSGSKVTVSWTAATDNIGVTGYNIYRNGSSTVLATVSGTTLTYSDTTVVSNTDYVYQVSAIDAKNNQSTKVTATPNPVHTPTTTDTSPPSTPTAPSVSGLSATGALVKWTASTDNVGVVGYHVYIRGTSSSADPVLLGDSTTASFTATCLAPGVNYTFTIKAYDAAGLVSQNAASVTGTTAAGTSGELNCKPPVDSSDLFIMLRNWNVTGVLPNAGDVNGDTKVDSTDLFALLRNWNK